MNTKTLGYSTMIVSAALMGCVGLFARNINTSGDVSCFYPHGRRCLVYPGDHGLPA